jgi:hypothetical protein
MKRPQLVHCAVLRADFTYLATNRDRDALGLELADVARDVHARLVVQPLLLGEIGLREIDECGRIDVDVVEAGRDRLERQLLHRTDFRRWVRPRTSSR